VREIDDIALISFIHKFKFAVRKEAKHIRVHIRTTGTLLKTKEGWKIINEHSSPIQGVDRYKEVKATALNLR